MNELSESYLFKELQKKNTCYAGLVEACWGVAEKLLRTIAATHPTYTSHGPDHALAVLHILDISLQPLNIVLNEEELYILISAALLHDIGMVGDVNADKMSRIYIRNAHHIRTLEYIDKEQSKLNIDRKYAKAIAMVSAAHRKIKIEEHVIERKIGMSSYSAPRTKLCAALLRMADECHMTEDRVAEDYGILNLPSVSLKHFKGHFNNIGIYFDRDKGVISFTVEIRNEELDTLYNAARKKIQKELDGLQSIFERNGIPYSKVILDEDRDDLIRRKIIKLLLKYGKLNTNELVKKLGEIQEKEDAVRRYLEIHGEIAPFALEDKDNYVIRQSDDAFYNIANDFLFNGQNKNDRMLFVRSELAKNYLSDELLDKLLKGSISVTEPKDVIFRVIRTSPSALRYILERRESLPRKTIAGVGGIVDSLKGELKNDFLEYPELLLEPGLLDDMFNQTGDPKTWPELKVRQIAEYHKIFDIQKLLSQWCTSNEKERKENPDLSKHKHSFKASFQFSSTSDIDPRHLFVASYRMKLPCRFEETDEFKIETSFDGEETKKDGKNVNMIEIKFDGTPPKINFPLPARISKKETKEYMLELKDGDSDNSHPLVFWMYIQGEPTTKGSSLGITCSLRMQMNSDLMDCEQLLLLLEARNKKITQVIIKMGTHESKIKTSRLSKLFDGILPEFSDEQKKVLTRLRQIQRLLKCRIPIPLFLANEDQSTILKTKIRSSQDAQKVLDEIRKRAETNQRYYSTISSEIMGANGKKIHRFYKFIPGMRKPNFKVEAIESNEENPQRLVEESLGNPKSNLEYIVGYLPLSPEATIEYLKQNTSTKDMTNVPNINALKKIATDYPEEYKTKATFKWLPEEEHIWYKITPFIVYLEQLTWERWLLEADYLLKVKKDYNRAYIAQREAFKNQPDNEDVVGSFGWIAYLCGRVEEAIRVTKNILKENQCYSQFIVRVNLGLYNLDMAIKNSKQAKTHLDSAHEYYTKAIEILKALPTNEKNIAMHSAVEDIVEYRSHLHVKADDYLGIFRGLKENDFSVKM